MSASRLLWSVAPVALLLGLALGMGRGGEADDALAQDEKLLKDAGLAVDSAALLDFFRQRTLTDADKARLEAAVRRLGDDSFQVRERASAELLKAGRGALPALRPALQDPDPEVARRARRCVEVIERSGESSLVPAAARLLAARRPAGAVEALLAFAPFGEDEAAEDEVREAVVGLGLRDGRADPAVLAALADADPARRALAAAVVGRAADPEQRRAAARLLTDADPRVRFQTAVALLHGRDKAAVPALIDLLAGAPERFAWQAEDLLRRVAGPQAPELTFTGADAEARRRCQAAWQAWWKEHAEAVDLAKVELGGRLLGLTLVCEAHLPGGGRVFECGLDGKPRWTVPVGNPIDAQMLPGGLVLVADCNGNQVVEMDAKGKVRWTYKINSPLRCQRLANGNTFIATYSALTEVTRGGAVLYSYPAEGHQYHACKLRDGHIVAINAGGLVRELDPAGKEVRRVVLEGGQGQSWACIEPLPGGRFLVALGGSHKVAEIDLAGKVYWERKVANPNSATRLPNGHTLVASHDDRSVYEFDRSGKEVWKQPTQGNPFRARRR